MQKPGEDSNRIARHNSGEIELEKMTLWDVDAVLVIENQSFPTPWPAWAFTRDLRSKRAICLVARVAGNLAGYAVAWILKWEMHIGNIAVAESCRRRHIGSALLQELLNRARLRRIRMVTLEVRMSNRPAIRLYRKFGFTEVAIKPDYYHGEGEDALVMALRTE
jgi:ribosomal-protein-alanine N-acetyltransferase